ncbi:alpha/beta hydrolase [Arthrobacter sp. NicSoilB8]|uniref:alpha/beta fold hydrolase n=1 Tax=Arthrobacter sp. NicSoilB8 TaxID=2830998 RepID=UPI001CC7BA5E|nr:alpha/beta hydrolase [Arthrobacter sp. NicSoilB8]BCW72732.1 dihydrolipoamide acetyltransferase [Arthrobacter sp. NicSoilB8]
MTDPVRREVSAAGHAGHVFASKAPGGGPAPAVVLIHGIGASHRYLRRLHRLLAASMDTYSIDLPGFGATPRPGHTLSVADHARYILGATEQLGVSEFVLVGHSMGTQSATEAALQEPGRIQQLVLMGPVVDPKRGTVAQQALALGRDAVFCESPSSNALVLTDYLRCGPVWYFKTLRVMMEYPLVQRLAGVTAPVLVLRGANDPVADADWSRRLAGLVRRGQLVEVQGTGHVVQHTRAVEVRDAILAFTGLRAPAGEPLPGH